MDVPTPRRITYEDSNLPDCRRYTPALERNEHLLPKGTSRCLEIGNPGRATPVEDLHPRTASLRTALRSPAEVLGVNIGSASLTVKVVPNADWKVVDEHVRTALAGHFGWSGEVVLVPAGTAKG